MLIQDRSIDSLCYCLHGIGGGEVHGSTIVHRPASIKIQLFPQHNSTNQQQHASPLVCSAPSPLGLFYRDTPQNLGNGKLQLKICRAVLWFGQVRFHSLAISQSLSGVVGSFWDLLGLVGSYQEFVRTCWELSGPVGKMLGLVGSVISWSPHSMHMLEQAPECFIQTWVLFIFSCKSFLHTNKPATMMQKMALSPHT